MNLEQFNLMCPEHRKRISMAEQAVLAAAKSAHNPKRRQYALKRVAEAKRDLKEQIEATNTCVDCQSSEPGKKKCGRCQEWKLKEEFPLTSTISMSRGSTCNECHRVRPRARRGQSVGGVV